MSYRKPGVLAVVMSALALSAAGAPPDHSIIEFAPTGSTGPFVIRGDEIVIPSGGVQVEFEVLLSGWGFPAGQPQLGAYNAQLVAASLLGANAWPPNPGVDLTIPSRVSCQSQEDCPIPSPAPVTQTGTCGMFSEYQDGDCDDFLGGFIVMNVCSHDHAIICRADADCPAEVACIENPWFALSGTLPSATVDLPSDDHDYIEWIGSAGSGAKSDPGGGARFHAGKLRLIVPPAAEGTYRLRFDEEATMIETGEDSLKVPGLILMDGRLTVARACCMPDGGCVYRIESECTEAGGMSAEGFCEEDTDTDGVVDTCDRCPNDNPDDSDDDGVCDSDDGCPDDPNKTAPGQCGCGIADSGDSDGDGLQDCVDQCPGVDDAQFAPECQGAIPALSVWGLTVMALLLLVVGKIRFGRRRLARA